MKIVADENIYIFFFSRSLYSCFFT